MIDLIPEGSGALEYGWHRSVDNDNWDVVEGAVGPEHVLTAEDAGCWLFAEWRYVDPSGARLAEGSSEATLDPIRLLSEDRDDLKDIVLKRRGEYNVSTREGPAKILIDVDEARDLVVLVGKALASLATEPSFEAPCKVLLLFEGAEEPSEGSEPDEALLLHGCKAVLPDDEARILPPHPPAPSLIILCLADEIARQEWKDALESRSAPPAIARASHILVKHAGSRRLSSWRDPEGKEIRKRTLEEATALLL
ncbi:MAG: hypothetical protein SGPRY_006577, partial [Prymnesium sp.]